MRAITRTVGISPELNKNYIQYLHHVLVRTLSKRLHQYQVSHDMSSRQTPSVPMHPKQEEFQGYNVLPPQMLHNERLLLVDYFCIPKAQACMPSAFLSIPNLFFFSLFPTTSGAVGAGGSCIVVLLAPISGLPVPFPAAAPSDVRGL